MAETWASSLGSVSAALIALSGALILYVLNRRHEVEQDERRRLQREEDERRQAKSAAVNRVLACVAMQPKDMLFAPLWGNAQGLELLSACMALTTTVGKDHPAVAGWAVEQHGRALAARTRYRFVAPLPLVRTRRAEAWGQELAVLAGALSLWEIGERGDSWFSERLTGPR